MSFEKEKHELYIKLLGINTKASTYATPEGAVLDLVNLDFSEPGSYTKRPGFTSGMAGNTFALNSPINEVLQYTSSLLDPSYSHIRTLALSERGFATYSWTLGQFSQFVTTSISRVTSSLTVNNWVKANLFSFAAFASEGQAYKLWDAGSFAAGTTIAYFGQAAPSWFSGAGITIQNSAFGGTFLAGSYNYYLANGDFQNFDINPKNAYSGIFAGPLAGPYTVSLGLGPHIVQFYNLTLTANEALYAPTKSILFRDNVPGFDPGDLVAMTSQNQPYSPGDIIQDVNSPNSTFFPDPFVYGETPNALSGAVALEVFNNQLWALPLAFYKAPNTVYVSEALNPQNLIDSIVLSEGNFPLVGLKKYENSILVGQTLGIFRITGTDITNFQSETITSEYGFVSHKAVVTWANVCWFLDTRGIVEYNGSNFKIVSDAIEKIISRINFNAAFNKAQGYYFKDRNEIWFSVPLDGSNYNNAVLVYDIIMGEWTTFLGFQATALLLLFQGGNAYTYTATKSIYFGDVSGNMNFFNASLMGDNGAGFTCILRSAFFRDMGNSTEKQFRRFYLDSGTAVSSTQTIGIEMFADHSSSAIAATAQMYQGAFQNRIDFGVPAKALSYRVSQFSSVNPFRINGYTSEQRKQRPV